MDVILLTATIALCLWAITDRHVPTGVAITSGLALIICACFAVLDGSRYTDRILRVFTIGMVLVGWGMFWRLAAKPIWRELASHWPFARKLAWIAGVERRVHSRKGD